MHVATNLNIDPELLEDAYKLSGLKSKREAVNTALREYIQRHRQRDLLKFINKVEYDDYSYKKHRSRVPAKAQ